jgi:hypothetical protein
MSYRLLDIQLSYLIVRESILYIALLPSRKATRLSSRSPLSGGEFIDLHFSMISYVAGGLSSFLAI